MVNSEKAFARNRIARDIVAIRRDFQARRLRAIRRKEYEPLAMAFTIGHCIGVYGELMDFASMGYTRPPHPSVHVWLLHKFEELVEDK